ncbi:alpha-L-rhamnosidase [Dinghuibacter silviterrae]|uniref:alpha-L-rhamnosidase n=1 Tax=Dinghuibacter silviterrae TaxID=1539049 RepID=A0A4R8DY69_9BACT|nr:alpha-L-rhamnosidase [Dinghuibacter silviterrae]TDX02161.1 alpha-L-rhamnosidase [Dinghuibacter silviterrae]
MFLRTCLAIATLAVTAAATAQTNLECEHLSGPLGIDAPRPRFSWQLSQGAQTAYRITVRTGQGAVWSSGKIASTAQLVPYTGAPLQPFTRYYWTVQTWDRDGRAGTPATAVFETGMMVEAHWKGSWIYDTRNTGLKPAALYRKTFTTAKTLASARAYIAVAGLYQLYINGQRIGDRALDPMYTRFDRRNLYVTYDVTKDIQAGKNTIGVELGNGWYNLQSTAVWYFDKAPWRGRPSFCMDLRLTYTDGTVETISTGKDWRTTLGPTIFNSIYTGEHYDANKEIPHWNDNEGVDTAWRQPEYADAPSKHIVAEAMVPIRRVDTLDARVIRPFSDTDVVFALKKNIAGVSEITLQAPRGTIVTLTHGERLYPTGHVDQSNINVHYRPTDDTDPFQTDIYICKGAPTETFSPAFNYKGFQYVEVKASKPIVIERLKAYVMHSDVKPSGDIQTSDSILQKIWAATNNSYLSNLFGYPTDCPQREKNGWTGDAHTAVETGLYNFDGITVYEKWLADHRDEQQPNGVLPSIIPSDGWGYEWGNGPDWTSSVAIIPWEVYLFYGDTAILSQNYDAIKRYVDHLASLFPDGICTWGLGDWIPVKSQTPVPFTSTAFYYTDAKILADISRILRRKDGNYDSLANHIKDAFNKKYLDPATGNYDQGFQTELSTALYRGLVPDDLKAKTAAGLAGRVKADGVTLDVGLLGTKTLLNALSENGYAGLAYQLASSTQEPSWGYWIVNGATALQENWPMEAKTDISRNHIMFGEISAWMYKALGGIRPDPANPGFRRVLLEPHIIPGVGYFSCSHDCPYGRITSAWTTSGKGWEYRVTLPPGTEAVLKLPGQPERLIKAGTFRYQAPEER